MNWAARYELIHRDPSRTADNVSRFRALRPYGQRLNRRRPNGCSKLCHCQSVGR
ncbi:hypothetical protein QWZ13_04245 [Reinekea marina]|uniref:hypothetical protein n=1 Tax=Reinekea marina TaxID=1310421 RepID=UPI0025B360B6|nr:hypothetical protein [Reinekea marina]MDN3648114.1 hypothetical protein [Reinekea marina]